MDFMCMLGELGMSKRGLAKELGYSANQVTRWKDNPPVFILRYLEMRVKFEKYDELEKKYFKLLDDLRVLSNAR